MSSPGSRSRCVIIVTPACPTAVILKLLHDPLPPALAAPEVFLFPHFPAEDKVLLDKENMPPRTRIMPSPAQSFFSGRHLGWLRENLRSAEHVVVLGPKSPYQNIAVAAATLLTMALAGKTITLLYPHSEDAGPPPEPGRSRHGQDFASQWISKELNLRFLAEEIGYHVWDCYPASLQRFFTYTDRELCLYFGAFGTDPVNLQPLDASPEAIQRDVDYALNTVSIWLGFLPGGEAFLRGKKVLEIGPGINFGAVLTLACLGAEVLVADRFLSPWDSNYHPKFYARLRETLPNRYSQIDLTPLDQILSKGGYPQDCITTHTCSLEELTEVPDQSVDLILSNAVFEHLYELKSAFAHLARITRPGGLGLHQVDFRDHRDYSRPLEHLLLSDREFTLEFKERHGECGNRFRPGEMGELFESVGFQVKEFRADQWAAAEYLADFLARLRQARKSRYRHYTAEKLREISGLFSVVKLPKS